MNIQYGDLYQLGRHKLICGDAQNKFIYPKLMGEEKANLVITDPPYGVSIEKKYKNILKKQEYNKVTNDDIPPSDLKQVLYHTFLNIKKNLKTDGSYYIFSPQGGDMQLLMMMMMEKTGIQCRHQLIWVKNRPVFSMNRLDYDYQHEPILYGWTKKHNFYRHNKQHSSILQFNQVKNKFHPTSKPPKLIATLIINSSQENNIILDTFGGGGTTLLVAEKLNRQCRMIEIDPHYCQTIINRWEKLTGQYAQKINK